MLRQQVPLIITFTAGFMMILAYFIPHPPIGQISDWFNDWDIIVISFALILGIVNLCHVNLVKISRRREGWEYSIVLLTGLAVTIVLGLWKGMEAGTPFDYVFVNFNVAMGSTMFSLLAFFVASAAFRAFRARTVDALLLLLAAAAVMLGRVPLGGYIHPGVPTLANWIMDIPNTAGQRAIMIGIALGMVSTSLRIMLGIERSYLGGVD
jgi:hypothetical protein